MLFVYFQVQGVKYDKRPFLHDTGMAVTNLGVKLYPFSQIQKKNLKNIFAIYVKYC